MRLLLDTPIALWAITDSSRLDPRARAMIVDPENTVAVSAASVWEIAIKHTLNRVRMPVSGSEALHWFQASGYDVVAVTGEHTAAVASLPPLHQDPFDRLIVAQALHEPYRLVTRDRTVASYDTGIFLMN